MACSKPPKGGARWTLRLLDNPYESGRARNGTPTSTFPRAKTIVLVEDISHPRQGFTLRSFCCRRSQEPG